MAGYSLGQADLLRRAMGKKKVDEMMKQREKFVDGAAKME
jgi:DNA polymerase-3 subunit alpha